MFFVCFKNNIISGKFEENEKKSVSFSLTKVSVTKTSQRICEFASKKKSKNNQYFD